MTTPEQLEIALRDFIYQCGKRYENELGCDDCIYWNFWTRFYTPHCDCPDEWTIYDKVSPLPS